MSDDDRRIYDLVARRFLAVFHPEAVFENTRVETTVAEHIFRTRGRVLLVPGWRGVYGEAAPSGDAGPTTRTTRARDAAAARSSSGARRVETREVEPLEKETKPPRRYSDASLLGAMETAGKLVDDDELREAMKDSGIGTPATRAAIIERLIDVGYVERDGRALVATEKGLNVIRLLGEHPLTSPGADRRLGAAARARSSTARTRARSSWATSRRSPSATVARARRQAQGRPHPAGQPRPVPGLRPRHPREPQGLLVLVARGPGLRLRDLEGQGGQEAPPAVARELIATGRTEKPVTGFKGRSGRSFRARLALAADRGGQVARRVRRAVGARGRQAARGRGRGGHAGRRARRRGRPGQRRSADARPGAGAAAGVRGPATLIASGTAITGAGDGSWRARRYRLWPAHTEGGGAGLVMTVRTDGPMRCASRRNPQPPLPRSGRAADGKVRPVSVRERDIVLDAVGDINLGDGPDVMAARGTLVPVARRRADPALGRHRVREPGVRGVTRGAAVPKTFNFRGSPAALRGRALRGARRRQPREQPRRRLRDTALLDTCARCGVGVPVGAGADLGSAGKPRVIAAWACASRSSASRTSARTGSSPGPSTRGRAVCDSRSGTAHDVAPRAGGADVVDRHVPLGHRARPSENARQRGFARRPCAPAPTP